MRRFRGLFFVVSFFFILGLSLFFSRQIFSADSGVVTIQVKILVCGDGVKDGNEDCDGSDLGGETCESQNYGIGTLSCDASCGFDVSGCVLLLPDSPSNFIGSARDHSIALSWSDPVSTGGSAITDYIVEYKLSEGGIWTTFPDGVGTTTNALITGLLNDISYEVRVSAVNSAGQGALTSEDTVIPGSPAQIIITEMGNLFIPNVTAQIRITNEGLSAYTYQYVWCITDSEANSCGDGDDIFNAVGAELIQPGESFNTDLSAVLLSQGDHWFHSVVHYGSDFSFAHQFFTAKDTLGSGAGGAVLLPLQSIPGWPSLGADFNYDDQVNIFDFFILLFYWKTPYPFKHSYVDINGDKQVNAKDFSILFYQWEKSSKFYK